MPPPDINKPSMTKLKSKGSQQRKLPGQGGLNDLAKTGRNINDYSKATPMTDDTPTALLTMFMGRR